MKLILFLQSHCFKRRLGANKCHGFCYYTFVCLLFFCLQSKFSRGGLGRKGCQFNG